MWPVDADHAELAAQNWCNWQVGLDAASWEPVAGALLERIACVISLSKDWAGAAGLHLV